VKALLNFDQKWFKIALNTVIFLFSMGLTVFVILGFTNVFQIQPDPNKFLLHEGLAALWGIAVSFLIHIFVLLIKKTPQFKNYIWWKRINSLSRLISSNLTYRIYRKVDVKPDNLPLPLEVFKNLIEASNESLYIKKLINEKWKSNALYLDLLMHSGVYSSLEYRPHLQVYNGQAKVIGFTISIETEGKFKQMDTILRDNDSLMRTIISNFERSLDANELVWETPILEIQPLEHFIKDSYWLSQMSEKSIITIHLKDNVLVSLGGEKLVVKLLYVDKPETVFIDDKFTFHLQQAIATFYGGKKD